MVPLALPIPAAVLVFPVMVELVRVTEPESRVPFAAAAAAEVRFPLTVLPVSVMEPASNVPLAAPVPVALSVLLLTMESVTCMAPPSRMLSSLCRRSR